MFIVTEYAALKFVVEFEVHMTFNLCNYKYLSSTPPF